MAVVCERTRLLMDGTRHITRRNSVAADCLPSPILPTKLPAGRHPRVRTNSVALFSELEDSVLSTVSTSYGPVLLNDQSSPVTGNCLGILLAALSGVLFTLNNFLFQYFQMNVTDMMLTRSSLQMAVVGLSVLLTQPRALLPARASDWVRLLSQAVFSATRVGFSFACLKFLPLGDALTVIFSEPLWTLILAKLFLKTRIGPLRAGFSLLLITGVTLCTQPPFLFSSSHGEDSNCSTTAACGNTTAREEVAHLHDDAMYYVGVVLALGAASTGSLQNIIVSRCEHIAPSTLVTWR